MTLNSAASSMSENASALDASPYSQRATHPELALSGQGCMPRIGRPAVTTNDVHGINLLLTAIVLGAQANVQWLTSAKPNPEAAQRTSERLLAQIQDLCELVDGLRSGRT
ncbi:hypothetical protein [Candidatus Phyllobacterium onerii]|uniref:hypothetical protein n=1 Tax=Candidatus Phyllobacterium onerii TaxID=3020828 RepID=UPI00233130FC|nr:hypothetical protein [Phyllobacterium sp. IY22]